MTSQTFIITYWNDGPAKANYFGLHMTHHGITIYENEKFSPAIRLESLVRSRNHMYGYGSLFG